RSSQGAVLQDAILRYSRLAVCATRTAQALNTYAAGRRRHTSAIAPRIPAGFHSRRFAIFAGQTGNQRVVKPEPFRAPCSISCRISRLSCRLNQFDLVTLRRVDEGEDGAGGGRGGTV